VRKKNQVQKKEKKEKNQVQIKTTRTVLLIGGRSDRLCLKNNIVSESIRLVSQAQ